jgi:hypothetical protein
MYWHSHFTSKSRNCDPTVRHILSSRLPPLKRLRKKFQMADKKKSWRSLALSLWLSNSILGLLSIAPTSSTNLAPTSETEIKKKSRSSCIWKDLLMPRNSIVVRVGIVSAVIKTSSLFVLENHQQRGREKWGFNSGPACVCIVFSGPGCVAGASHSICRRGLWSRSCMEKKGCFVHNVSRKHVILMS